MKRIGTFFAAILMVFSSISALADDYQYLTVSGDNGESSFTVSNIQKITFEAQNMVVHLADGTTQQLPLSGLQKLFFSNSSSSVEALSTMQSSIQFSGGILRAFMVPGEVVALYNMKGAKVFSTNESGTYDLSTLSRGVYIIKVGNESKKVINK